eukprot:bmy_00498T0
MDDKCLTISKYERKYCEGLPQKLSAIITREWYQHAIYFLCLPELKPQLKTLYSFSTNVSNSSIMCSAATLGILMPNAMGDGACKFSVSRQAQMGISKRKCPSYVNTLCGSSGHHWIAIPLKITRSLSKGQMMALVPTLHSTIAVNTFSICFTPMPNGSKSVDCLHENLALNEFTPFLGYRPVNSHLLPPKWCLNFLINVNVSQRTDFIMFRVLDVCGRKAICWAPKVKVKEREGKTLNRVIVSQGGATSRYYLAYKSYKCLNVLPLIIFPVYTLTVSGKKIELAPEQEKCIGYFNDLEKALPEYFQIKLIVSSQAIKATIVIILKTLKTRSLIFPTEGTSLGLSADTLPPLTDKQEDKPEIYHRSSEDGLEFEKSQTPFPKYKTGVGNLYQDHRRKFKQWRRVSSLLSKSVIYGSDISLQRCNQVINVQREPYNSARNSTRILLTNPESGYLVIWSESGYLQSFAGQPVALWIAVYSLIFLITELTNKDRISSNLTSGGVPVRSKEHEPSPDRSHQSKGKILPKMASQLDYLAEKKIKLTALKMNMNS